MKYPTPKALRRAGTRRVETLLRKHAPQAWKRWTTAIFTVLDGQTVVVAGTDVAAIVLPQIVQRWHRPGHHEMKCLFGSRSWFKRILFSSS